KLVRFCEFGRDFLHILSKALGSRRHPTGLGASLLFTVGRGPARSSLQPSAATTMVSNQMRQDSWVSLVSAILLSLAGVGCASSASVAPVIPAELSQVPVEPAAIRAENFGAEVHALLGTKQAS